MHKPSVNIPETQGAIGPKEAAEALNEQGFLFAQVIRDRIANRIAGTIEQSHWYLEGQEYPVTALDGSQTRIDLILCHRRVNNVYLCLECKRPNRKYKSWLFFDRLPKQSPLYLETISQHIPKGLTNPNPAQHKIAHKQASHSCDVFNYYLESAIKRNSDAASSTETIERAMRQLVAGQSGLLSKFRTFSLPIHNYRSVPVMVTSAQLYEAEFEVEAIDKTNGTIKESDLNLKAMDFCAVNYHADDSLTLNSPWGIQQKSDIKTDISHLQTRTVFITQASALDHFLSWASGNLTDMS